MVEVNLRYPDNHEYIWKCDCAGWHYLEISWDEADPDSRWIELVDTYWPHRFRDRLAAAWKVIRGKPHYARGIVLNEKSVKEVLEVLGKYADD